MRHSALTNHPTDQAEKNLHLPGYVVASVDDLGAITTMTTGDIAYVSGTGVYYVYTGSAWQRFGLEAAASGCCLWREGMAYPPSVATIADGVISVSSGQHGVQAESGDTDVLTSISGGVDGQVLILRAVDGHTITVESGTGNILLNGSDYTMSSVTDVLVLLYDSTLSMWLEMSRI